MYWMNKCQTHAGTLSLYQSHLAVSNLHAQGLVRAGARGHYTDTADDFRRVRGRDDGRSEEGGNKENFIEDLHCARGGLRLGDSVMSSLENKANIPPGLCTDINRTRWASSMRVVFGGRVALT